MASDDPTIKTFDQFIKVMKRRKILPEYSLGTVVGDGTTHPIEGTAIAVILDGDTTPVTAEVICTLIRNNSRVMTMYVNGGYYVIGVSNNPAPRGLMAGVQYATGTVGPTSGTTVLIDPNFTDYVFFADATHIYRVVVTGVNMAGTVVGDRFIIAIRDGGSTTPVAGSPTIGHDLPIEIQTPSLGYILSTTFTTTEGIHTLRPSYVRNTGTGTASPGGNREIYVEDLGPF